MLNRTGGVLALVGMCALSVLLLSCGSSSSRPSGLLYVVSDANFNISSFSIDLDNGGLSLINSNAHTCTTLSGSNPVSCGLPRNILLDPTKNVAFMLNQGLSVTTGSSVTVAPTVYGYTVNSDGSLSSPTVSATPVVGAEADTAVTMTENAAGTLLFVLDVGPTLTPTDCPGIPNNGPDCPAILVYDATPGSTTLTQESVLQLSSIPTALSVLTFAAPNGGTPQTLLFMTSNKDLTTNNNDNELSVFSVNTSTGVLTPAGDSPYTTAPNPGVVLAVNTNTPPETTGGVYVYVGSQGSAAGTIEAFAVCTVQGTQGNGGNNCSQSQVQNNELISIGSPVGAGKTPIAMLVDPTNNFLYVAANASSQVFAFLISGATGTLSPLPPVTSEPAAGPVALVMHQNYNNSGQFLYSSNNVGSTITGISVNATTGALSTNPSTTLFLQGSPYGMAAK
ncbi:MAG: beta-propeller fold lactonase family protein [Terriglobales bacterium]